MSNQQNTPTPRLDQAIKAAHAAIDDIKLAALADFEIALAEAEVAVGEQAAAALKTPKGSTFRTRVIEAAKVVKTVKAKPAEEKTSEELAAETAELQALANAANGETEAPASAPTQQDQNQAPAWAQPMLNSLSVLPKNEQGELEPVASEASVNKLKAEVTDVKAALKSAGMEVKNGGQFMIVENTFLDKANHAVVTNTKDLNYKAGGITMLIVFVVIGGFLDLFVKMTAVTAALTTVPFALFAGIAVAFLSAKSNSKES